MKKSLMLCGLLLALTASIASAAAGVNLRWNLCLGDVGLSNKVSTCLVNTGSQTLVGSYELGANLTQASGIEIVLDIATASASLPAWWLFKNAGSCRSTSLTMNAVNGSASGLTCIDWGSGPSGGLAAYNVGGIPGANTARVIAGFAVGAPLPDLVAAQEYFAFNAKIDNLKTVGTGACLGCSVPACIVLNSVKVATPPVTGQPSRDVVLSGPTNGTDSNFVTWQGGAGTSTTRGNGCPAATPTHSATWGSVKSLYR